MKDRLWTITCFIMGTIGFSLIVVVNAGISLFDAFLWWYCETKRLVKDQMVSDDER